MDVDVILKKTQEHMEGYQSGKESAMKQYDQLFIELFKQLEDINKKLDEMIKK